MKRPTKRLCMVVLLVLPLAAGCADRDRGTEARELRDALAAMPAVQDVRLDYAEPITLDSGKVRLDATMRDDGSPGQVAAVAEAAYEAFRSTHHTEETDLDIRIGDDRLHLRGFEPTAEVAAVADAMRRAAEVGATVPLQAEVDTQWVEEPPHVHTRMVVELREGGPQDVLYTLDLLQRRHGGVPDAGWSVRAGGEHGWALGSLDGFPEQAERQRWNALRRDLPPGFTVALADRDMVTVQLSADVSPETATAVARRHVDSLGGHRKAVYEMLVAYDTRASVIHGDCVFSTDPVGRRLQQELADGCAKVRHPEPAAGP